MVLLWTKSTVGTQQPQAQSKKISIYSLRKEIEALSITLQQVKTQLEELTSNSSPTSSSEPLEVYDWNGEGGTVSSLEIGTGLQLTYDGQIGTIGTFNYDYQGDNGTIESLDDSTTIRFVGATISRDSNGVVITINNNN